MISILEEPATREMVVPISRELYSAAGTAGLIERNVELLEGFIVKKMPKSPYHILLVRRLIEMLEAYYSEFSSETCFVAKEDPISAGDSEPEPDIAVLSGSPETFADELPSAALFIIEVAVSTLEKDRLKAQIYAEINVPEYWVVDADSKRVEIFTKPDAKARVYEEKIVLESDDVAKSLTISGFEVNLSQLFHR